MIQPVPSGLLPSPVLMIGGQRLSGSGETVIHHYAATGLPVAEVRLGNAADVDAAVRSARAALPAWRAMEPSARRDLMLRTAALLLERQEQLAVLGTVDTGLTVNTVRAAVASTVEWLRYYAGWADKINGQVIPAGHSALDYVQYEPYGVIGVIVPSNSAVSAMILGPALATGNCVVLKPSELTPHTASAMAQVFLDAGIPPGVVNVVAGGREAGEALVRHPGVDKVHFTGSTSVGARVAGLAASLLKPAGMELGGKSANLVFADADLDIAADVVVRSLTRHAGQSCVAGTRILVQDSIADELLRRCTALLAKQIVGDPLDSRTAVGPVVSETACTRISTVIEQATRERWGRVAAGGRRLGGELAGGYFIDPTIFSDVDNESPLAQEETFGPVVSFIRFGRDEDAIAMANGTPYGLAAYIQTTDLNRAHRTAAQLDAGLVWINGTRGIPSGGPFGGNKHSGFGRLGGTAGLHEFMRSKQVWIGL